MSPKVKRKPKRKRLTRPVQHAEATLLAGFLDGEFPSGSTLPAERALSLRFGVTRPTLREALRSLERDGWVTIRQGKPTLVNHFWSEGGLNILGAILSAGREVPPDFIPNLLEVRLALAPSYARAAVEHSPRAVVELLAPHVHLSDEEEPFAAFDWRVHKGLTLASNNAIFTLILNGFVGVYEPVARLYFTQEEARRASRRFYLALSRAAERKNAAAAEQVTADAMRESIAFFHRIEAPGIVPTGEAP